MASNYVLNQKITAALAKSAEALAAAQGAGGGGGGGSIGSLSEVLDTARTTAPTATDGDALHFPIKNAGEIESTNHQIIKHAATVNGTPTALGDVTSDSANGDNLLIKTVGTRNIQIGATSGTDKIGFGKVPDSAGSKMQVEGTVESTAFSVKDSGNTSHSVASYDNTDNLVQLSSASDPVRILAPSSAVYDFTASELKSTEKVRFDNSGLHSPANLNVRPNGDRVVLYTPAVGTNIQYTLGIEGGALRMSSGQDFRFYYRPPTYFTELGAVESEAFRIESQITGTNRSFKPMQIRGDLNVLDSTATTTSLHVDTVNRRVGINKANPTEDLDVDGNIQINTSGTGRLIFYDSNGAHEHAELDGEDDGTNGGKLVLKTKTDGGAVAARVTIDGVGAIGIGPTPNYGTSGQVLTSQGPATTPIWATPSGGGGTTVYGGVWYPFMYPIIWASSAQVNMSSTAVTNPFFFTDYIDVKDTTARNQSIWYDPLKGGRSAGRYTVTVIPGTPNRYKVDLWFNLSSTGTRALNDTERWGYNIYYPKTGVTTGNHPMLGYGATNGEVVTINSHTFGGNGEIVADATTIADIVKLGNFVRHHFDISHFRQAINAQVGSTLVFDTEFVPSRVGVPAGYNYQYHDVGAVNVSACVFHEAFKAYNGINPSVSTFRQSTNDINKTAKIIFNDKGNARQFYPSDTVTATSGAGNTNTSLWPNNLANADPYMVPFGYTPNDIFTVSTLTGTGQDFFVNPQQDGLFLTEFSGSLSFWMVEDA